MARPIRIEYVGAFYHVTSRGKQQEIIFAHDDDRIRFLTILSAIIRRYKWRCHGYCLMDNHYHLIIETQKANLSKGMRQLNGVYTQSHNRKYSRVGPVFQGRYKAIIVDKNNFYLELIRHVELNPVRVKLVKHPKQYKWSSYRARSGEVACPSWLTINESLNHFAKKLSTAQKRYVEFVAAGPNSTSIWSILKRQIYLGNEHFINKHLKLITKDAADNSLTNIAKSQRYLKTKPFEHFVNQFKDQKTAMAKAYRTGAYSQKQIAAYFGVHYSTVSRAIKNWEQKTETH